MVGANNIKDVVIFTGNKTFADGGEFEVNFRPLMILHGMSCSSIFTNSHPHVYGV
ncbi:hypothetical protein [Azospirillum palustre]